VSWAAILALAAGSYLLKATGPLLLGERTPASLARLADLVTPALLAALIAVQTFADEKTLVVDARAAGLLVAAVAVWRRAPFVAVVVLAASVTALIRAL
jgi:branched-subunit amino acid transport protein